MLELRGVSKTYHKKSRTVAALKEVSLKMEKGSFNAIVGRSGAGKSTLLRLLAGLEHPDAGEYWFEGQNQAKRTMAQLRKFRFDHIGLMQQQAALIDYFTVFENVQLPLLDEKTTKEERRARVDARLNELGLFERASFYPGELSGGEYQRAAVARALVRAPSVLLVDEPLASLDGETAENVMNVFRELNHKGLTVGIILHNEAFLRPGDHIIRLEQGRLMEG